MACLGLEPRAAGWQAQTNPLSYGGTPYNNTFRSIECSLVRERLQYTLKECFISHSIFPKSLLFQLPYQAQPLFSPGLVQVFLSSLIIFIEKCFQEKNVQQVDSSSYSQILICFPLSLFLSGAITVDHKSSNQV